MKTRKKILQKLRERSGESITEVLVAVLVSAVGLVLLAGMITATANLVEKSKNMMKDYVVSENTVVERYGSSGPEGTIEMKSGVQSIKLTDDHASASVKVVYFVNPGIGGVEVVSYMVK